MQFEYDPERLIEEVKKRPGIWDFDHIDYKTPAVRYQLWTEIVTEMLDPDMQVSKGEIRELELQLQKKWKSIRDCFIKCLSKPNRRRRPYIYHNKLTFLLKGSEATIDSTDSEGTTKPKFTWRKKLMKKKQYENNSSSDNNDTFDDTLNTAADDSAPPEKKPKKKTTDAFAFASVDVVPSTYEATGEDPDKMFLLSLMPHLKSIPEAFRLNVKMELMQVLKSAQISTSKFKI